MGAEEPVNVQAENGEGEGKEEEKWKEEEEMKDIEKGEVGGRDFASQNQQQQHQGTREFHMSRMQRLSATNPLRLVVENATRVASPSPAYQTHHPPSARPSPSPAQSIPPRPSPAPSSQPRSTPTPQVGLACVFLLSTNILVKEFCVGVRSVSVYVCYVCARFFGCLVGYM